MKSTLSAVVIACLIASPVAGCAASRGPRQLDPTFGVGSPAESEWSRVRQLIPAAEIVVTTTGSPPGSRYFVSADQSTVTVLNLTAPTLPATTRSVLRDIAANHPESFAAMQKAGSFGQGDVRIGRDGLFVADRKLADLAQIVETIARSQVLEIQGPVVARGSVIGTLVGGWLGFSVGVVPALGGAPEGVAWLLLIGSSALGGYLGFHWTSHETEGIVYRAP